MNFFLQMNRWTMTSKHNLVVILAAAIISAGIWITSYYKASKCKAPFSIRVYEGLNGWGYDIFAGNRLFIHQEHIPGIEGKKGFMNKEQAKNAANLVLRKLEQNVAPTLTTFEVNGILSTD